MSNKRRAPTSTDFASLLSQHTKVKRQRKQPRKKSTHSETITEILAHLRRICATGELLATSSTSTTSSSSAAAASSSTASTAATTPRAQQTLALCFLCVEALPHRKLWQEWLRQAKQTAQQGGHGLRIFIHAKFPDRLDPWSQQYLIRDERGEIINFKPEWGKIEVTRALMKLFETALLDPTVGRMTYVSESCIPIVTFDHACQELWSNDQMDRSWVAAYDKPVNGYDTLMMNAVNIKYIPKECVRKCDTWIMLTRQHAHAILIDVPRIVGSEVWPHFSRVKVADEIFMPTMMTVIGAIQGGGIPGGSGKRMGLASDRTDQVERRKTTHVDWSKGGPHPKAFEAFTKQVQTDGISHGCIFARKFGSGTCPVNVWREVCGVAVPTEADAKLGAHVVVVGGEGSAENSNGGGSSTTAAAVEAVVASAVVPFTGKRNVLVIVCAGDTSLHDYERWYASNRTYDLCVVYYGNDTSVAQRYQRESDYYHAQQGPKWQLIRSILQKKIHSTYEYIWMPVSLQPFFYGYLLQCLLQSLSLSASFTCNLCNVFASYLLTDFICLNFVFVLGVCFS